MNPPRAGSRFRCSVFGKARAGRLPFGVNLLDLDEEKEDEKEKTVVAGVRRYTMSADGKKLLVITHERQMAIVVK